MSQMSCLLPSLESGVCIVISTDICSSQLEVFSHGCDLHDTHSCSERGILRGDFINSMFCSTAVLRAGPVWLDIKAAMTLALPSKVFCGSRLCVCGVVHGLTEHVTW